MAITKVDDVCPICKQKIEPGMAIYITKVRLTDVARGVNYRTTEPLPDGKIRIKHLGNSNPRVCLHQGCYEDKIQAILFGKKK